MFKIPKQEYTAGAARAAKGSEPALGQAFFDLLCAAQGREVIVGAGFTPVD